MKKSFTLEYWRDGDWYVGRLRDVPGVFSQGKSLEELEENIREVFKLMAEDEDVPSEPIKTKEVFIEV